MLTLQLIKDVPSINQATAGKKIYGEENVDSWLQV